MLHNLLLTQSTCSATCITERSCYSCRCKLCRTAFWGKLKTSIAFHQS